MHGKAKALIALVATLVIAALGGVGVVKIIQKSEKVEIEAETTINYSEEEVPATIDGDLMDDQGEYIETTEYDGEEIPTVESIDHGEEPQFEDIDTGVSTEEGEYTDLGAIENVNTSSVKAFVDSTLNRCIIANNRYGAQCVSLARAFWWSYAGRDVSTCGTGVAKGMMDCWQQNAGKDFRTIWDPGAIQAGTWIITGGSYTGHICMALGPAKNGYVACLGENQGGKSCGTGVGGAATNIINFNIKDFIGGYTPNAYIVSNPEPELKPTPAPAPAPAVDTCKVRTVKKGETMGKIMKECTGKIEWGEAMNEYAHHWVSKERGVTVFFGWTHGTGYGLIAGQTIEYRK